MALSIKISNDDGNPFSPGSFVLGVVKLVTNEDQPIDKLTINFSGCADVLLIHSYGDLTTSRRDYKSVAYIFSQQLNLYEGKYTHRKGTYMWPFAFRIPDFAAPRTLHSDSLDFFQAKHPWKSDYRSETHPLPPSMYHSGPFHCSVEYLLRATLPRSCTSRIALSRTISAVKAVQIRTPSREPDLRVEGDLPYASYRHTIRYTLPSSSRMIKNRLCWRLGGIRKRLKQEAMPKVELRVSVLMPKKMILQEDATLSVLVAANALATTPENATIEGSEDIRILQENLFIKSFKVSLLQHTQVRAGCLSSISDKRVYIRRGSCVLPLSNRVSARPCPSTGTNNDTAPASFVNLADMADLRVPTGGLVPDFSTYNIATSHTLEVKFKMKYENKTFKFRLWRVPIRVLSPNCDTTAYRDILQSEHSGSQSLSDEVWSVHPPSECDAEDAIDDFFAEAPPKYSA